MPTPEGVVQLGGGDHALLEAGGHALDQLDELGAVRGTVGTVAVGSGLDRLEHQAQERATELAVFGFCPLLHPAQEGPKELHALLEGLGRGDGTRLAGDGQRHADHVQLVHQLLLGFFQVHQVAVHLHLPAALAQVPDGTDLVAQTPQLLHREVLDGFGVGQGGFNRRAQRLVHGRVVVLQHLHVLVGLALHAR